MKELDSCTIHGLLYNYVMLTCIMSVPQAVEKLIATGTNENKQSKAAVITGKPSLTM